MDVPSGPEHIRDNKQVEKLFRFMKD